MTARPKDHIIKTFRPAIRSGWFLFFGLALGPAVIFFERDPGGGYAQWVVLFLICLGVLLHRLGLRYTLSQRRLTARAWWGRGREETVTLAHLRRVRPAQGIAGRLAGCGHLEVESDAFDEGGLSLLGQPGHLHLAREIEELAAQAKAGAAEGDHGPI